MARRLVDIVEGWTAELGPFTLLSAGAAVDLTGLDVTLILTDVTGTPVSIDDSQVRIATDQSADRGKVYFTPAEGQLVHALSPYAMRWEVIDGAGKVAYWPNTEADQLVVNKP